MLLGFLCERVMDTNMIDALLTKQIEEIKLAFHDLRGEVMAVCVCVCKSFLHASPCNFVFVPFIAHVSLAEQ